jgi:hypothetical protein
MIFNFRTPGNLERALRGERIGTLITNKSGWENAFVFSQFGERDF